MENLNKENFWNELYAKYPDAMKEFCKWIDEYKERNNWNKLFNFGSPHYAKQGWHDVKYHDLPFAMQIGIWIEFAKTSGEKGQDCVIIVRTDNYQADWKVLIADFFRRRQIAAKEVSAIKKQYQRERASC